MVPYLDRCLKVMNRIVRHFLVAETIFVFLGNLRAAVITALVIPISIVLTLAIMTALGDSANLLSIGAIDFGIIADIALVLTENYIRVARRSNVLSGTNVRTGSDTIVKATQEVGASIILLVFIIIVAFIPIFTMKGAEKQIFSPMAKTYSYALFFTLLLTFTYLIASIRVGLVGREGKGFRFISHERLLYGLHRSVAPEWPYRPESVAGLLLAGFIAGFVLLGTQFLPKMDEGNIYIRITFPHSISLHKTFENAKKVRNVLMGFTEAKSVAVRVGRPEDGTEATGPFNTEYYLNLYPYSQWKRSITKEQWKTR
jgi:cobalt-zinc-cadmium resistance protein CzcA